MHSIIRSGFVAAALAAGLGAATAANASVVFDNTKEPFFEWGSSSGLLGMEFVPSASGLLESLQLPLATNTKAPHHAIVTLYAGPQTTLLDSWDFDVTDNAISAFAGLTTLTPDTPVNLTAGAAYWVFLSSPSYFTDGGVAWAFTEATSGTLYPNYIQSIGGYIQPGGDFNYQFNMKVLAGAVPEPATWALFILGFGSIGALLRSKRERGMAAA